MKALHWLIARHAASGDFELAKLHGFGADVESVRKSIGDRYKPNSKSATLADRTLDAVMVVEAR